MSTSQPLRPGKKHHVCIIYNHARSKLSKTEDTEYSLKFVEELDARLSRKGCDDNFYHDRDALPGRNKFSELYRLIKCSEWIVVVLTKSFLRDCWYQYQQMATFNELLEECKGDPQSGTQRLLPILLGIDKEDIPINLKLTTTLTFDEHFMTDETEWNKLCKVLSQNNAVTDTSAEQNQSVQSSVVPTTVHAQVSVLDQNQPSTGNEYHNTAPVSSSAVQTSSVGNLGQGQTTMTSSVIYNRSSPTNQHVRTQEESAQNQIRRVNPTESWQEGSPRHHPDPGTQRTIPGNLVNQSSSGNLNAMIQDEQRTTDQGQPVLHPSSTPSEDLSMDQLSIDGARSIDSQTILKSLENSSHQSPVRVVRGTADGRELNTNPVQSLLGEDLEVDDAQSSFQQSSQQTNVPVPNVSQHSNTLSNQGDTIEMTNLPIKIGNTLHFESLQKKDMDYSISSENSQEKSSDDADRLKSGTVYNSVLKHFGRSIIQQLTGYEMVNK